MRFPPPELGVYPRVCGGTLNEPPDDAGGIGLSPRVRGNLPAHRHAHPHARSIPACAGEPRSISKIVSAR